MKKLLIAAASAATLFSAAGNAEIIPTNANDGTGFVRILADGVDVETAGSTMIYEGSNIGLQFSFDLTQFEATDQATPADDKLSLESFLGVWDSSNGSYQYSPEPYTAGNFVTELLAAKDAGNSVASITVDLGALSVGNYQALTSFEGGYATDQFIGNDTFSVVEKPAEVPVPATAMLFGLGLLGLRRFSKKK